MFLDKMALLGLMVQEGGERDWNKSALSPAHSALRSASVGLPASSIVARVMMGIRNTEEASCAKIAITILSCYVTHKPYDAMLEPLGATS